MLGGGIPPGYSVLLAGPSGSGKSVLATQFISEGARHDEPGIIAVFEKRPAEHSQDGVMAVVKVRGSAHSKDLRAFEITEDGIVMGDALAGYEGLLTGRPEPVG